MFDFDALSHAICRQTVLCVGDLMLDEFVYGEVMRISPEAPVPVIAVQRSVTSIGGAGNVARNIASIGARCIFVGLIGEDDAGDKLKAQLSQEGRIESVLVCDPARPTTRKVRFVSEHFSTHMLRADWELASPASGDIEQKLIDVILPQLPRADIVLLSDYAKGVLTTRVIRNVIEAARKLGKRVIVDPKSANFAIYRGATLLTPNRKEFLEATRSGADSERSVADAAQDAIQLADCDAMLVTQSEHGMTLVPRNGEAVHVPAHPVKVRDVSGAGDTVAAVLAASLAAGADWETAVRMANAAAAVAVSKKGTAVVTPAELRRRILPHAYLAAEEKIVAVGGDLDAYLLDWRKQGLRIGFTNGRFDILHPGHVKVLTAARGACDRLIVGLNSDASVKRLKGEGRPVQNEGARAEVLAALEAVDLVAVFEEDTPISLITRIKPSVLVKGGDYTRDQVVGHEIVEAHGGEVVLVEILPGFSTTSLVDRARWQIVSAVG
jgi:D-beta-D-heptose 7-phosphate kinase / D-beta-D-heptose 1-phosphate adenosyltransferase